LKNKSPNFQKQQISKENTGKKGAGGPGGVELGKRNAALSLT
jgi:hypothetical protein